MIKVLNDDAQLSKNFKLSEFKCKCGCESVILDMSVVGGLQQMRDKVGSITVAVGFRCQAFNAKVKGASPNSRHMKGQAADIKPRAGVTVFDLARAAYAAGFRGIGISDNQKYGHYYVHVDMRETPSYWVYDRDNNSKAVTKETFLHLIK